MTREEIEALKAILDEFISYDEDEICLTYDETVLLIDFFTKLLEQEPILDKIRSELIEEKECAYADFERYKVEYLGQSWDDVYDSLPQDDFRYGMERCIEIIDKYKAESEDKE